MDQSTLMPAAPAETHRPVEKGGRFTVIDALRGIAALGVVFFHAYAGGHVSHLATALGSPGRILFSSGKLGIAIFFVISGFVIAHALRNARVTLSYFGRFLLRRSIRLDPPYWISIALMLLHEAVARRSIPGRAAHHVDIGQIVAHLFYVQTFFHYPHINDIYWTLCFEIQFYVLFCLMLMLGQRLTSRPGDWRGTRWVLAACALLAAAWPLRLIHGPGLEGLCTERWHAFLIGVIAYLATSGRVPPIWLWAYSVLLLAGTIWPFSLFTVAAVIVAVGVAIGATTGRLETGMNWRWLQFLGAISYSLYLTHNPVSGAMFRIAYKVVPRTVAGECIALVGVVAGCVFAAWVFWWLIERPSIALSRKIVLQRKPVATP